MAFGTQLKEEEELNRRILENLEKIKLVGYARGKLWIRKIYGRL